MSDLIDTFVQSAPADTAQTTVTGLGETLGRLTNALGQLASGRVSIYDVTQGKTATTAAQPSLTEVAQGAKPALLDNFPLAGKRSLNLLIVIGGALALAIGAIYFLFKK
jgi:hypothetical protein